MPRPRPALIVLGLLAMLLGLLGFREYRQRLAVTAAAQQTEIDALNTALGAARTRLTVAEARQIELGDELNHMREQLAAREAALITLQTENTRLTAELAQMATRSTELVSAYDRTMAELARQLDELARPEPAVSPVIPLLTTHRSRTAQVVSVGPSSAFVIINYGAAHGALPRQEMLIMRGTDTIARVQISDVREQHSVAQVLPDSLSGVLHKGDSAVLSPPSP
jgi:hypothetical protein